MSLHRLCLLWRAWHIWPQFLCLKLAQFPLSQITQPSQASSASSNRIHPLQQALWAQNFEVPIIETAHGTLMRISAQAYNYLDEYRTLGRALQLLQNAY